MEKDSQWKKGYQTLRLNSKDSQKSKFATHSPPLRRFPERVLIITDKNFASVCTHLVNALKSGGMDARYIDALKMKDTDAYVKDCFNIDHSKILAIFYDPTEECFTKNIQLPMGVPWGLYRGSLFYRVDNLLLIERKKRSDAMRGKGGMYGIMPSSNKTKNLKRTNATYDSLTPLVMCGTECLLNINPEKSVFLGQAYNFDKEFNPNKLPDSIGHLTVSQESVTSRNIRKGTDKIALGFKNLSIKHEILGWPHISNERAKSFMNEMGFFVMTMTTWDSGLGYAGLEAISNSCLVMSKLPETSKLINSPLVHVQDPEDLIEKVNIYSHDVNAFNNVRRMQYDWAKKNFSYEGIAKRFRAIVEDCIKNGWHKADPKFRRLDG